MWTRLSQFEVLNGVVKYVDGELFENLLANEIVIRCWIQSQPNQGSGDDHE